MFVHPMTGQQKMEQLHQPHSESWPASLFLTGRVNYSVRRMYLANPGV